MTRVCELGVGVLVIAVIVVVVTNASVVVTGHVYTSHGQPFRQPDFFVNPSNSHFL